MIKVQIIVKAHIAAIIPIIEVVVVKLIASPGRISVKHKIVY